jgi:CBS domain containing-hemolysin-like protein
MWRAPRVSKLVLLFIYVSFALGISFFCSLLEAAFLACRSSTLKTQKSDGNRGAALLLQLKQHRSSDAISAILILNTGANTLGATLAGAQAAKVFGNAWIGIFSGVLTLLILLLSEIIPKTLGATYCRQLSGFVGRSLTILTALLAPALVLSRTLTRLLTRGDKGRISRDELAVIINTATDEGAISGEEAQLFTHLLDHDDVQVEDVMTPRTVAFLMPADATINDLLQEPGGKIFSRIPLYRGNHDTIVGYVLLREILHALADGQSRDLRLEQFKREIWFIPELATLASAMRQFLERREPLAMVTDEHGGIAGLVTLEDLTETFLGAEIIDELDKVVDLRKTAARLRDERLKRLRLKRQFHAGSSDTEPSKD